MQTPRTVPKMIEHLYALGVRINRARSGGVLSEAQIAELEAQHALMRKRLCASEDRTNHVARHTPRTDHRNCVVWIIKSPDGETRRYKSMAEFIYEQYYELHVTESRIRKVFGQMRGAAMAGETPQNNFEWNGWQLLAVEGNEGEMIACRKSSRC
jgi:hypothetical protein